MVSLPRKILGMPVGVNQILFGVLTMNLFISVLSQRLLVMLEKTIACPFPSFAKFQKKERNTIVIITGAKVEIRFLFLGLENLSKSEFKTTETELNAIANPANSGLSVSHRLARMPAAIGIPSTL